MDNSPPDPSLPSASPPGAGLWRDGPSDPVFWLVLAVLLASALMFPLYQLLVGGGHVYYTNGFDEAIYLNYDYSRLQMGMARTGQAVVTALQQLGLGGGRVNLLLDAGSLVAFPLLVRACFRRLEFRRERANAAALAMVVVPVLLLGANPLVKRLSDWVVTSGAIAWLNVPEALDSPLLRTPEPQFSLVLLAAVTLAALTWKRFWPVYVVLPLLYPFVALPAAFVLLAVHLHAAWPFPGKAASAGPLLSAFGAVVVATWANYHWLMSPTLRTFVVPTHLPLVPLSGLLAIGAYGLLRPTIPLGLRFAALAVALSDLVVNNYQVISGYVAQPDNFEQYWGCVAIALIVALGNRAPAWPRQVILAVGTLCFLSGSYQSFRSNLADVRGIPLTPQLLQALKDDPTHVVVGSWHVGNNLSMIFPRTPFTALAFGRTFGAPADRNVVEYRCIKRQALAAHPNNWQLAQIFKDLDRAYRFGSLDYVRLAINRRTHLEPLRDVSATGCTETAPLPLRYFLIP